MEEVILNWNEMGILEQVLENKLLYIESKDTQATALVFCSKVVDAFPKSV